MEVDSKLIVLQAQLLISDPSNAPPPVKRYVFFVTSMNKFGVYAEQMRRLFSLGAIIIGIFRIVYTD